MSKSSAGDLLPTLHPVYQAHLDKDSVSPQIAVFPTVTDEKKGNELTHANPTKLWSS